MSITLSDDNLGNPKNCYFLLTDWRSEQNHELLPRRSAKGL